MTRVHRRLEADCTIYFKKIEKAVRKLNRKNADRLILKSSRRAKARNSFRN
jgi:hypothetical protein